jgi:hypothetical protein
MEQYLIQQIQDSVNQKNETLGRKPKRVFIKISQKTEIPALKQNKKHFHNKPKPPKVKTIYRTESKRERKKPYYFLKGLKRIPNKKFKNYLGYCRSKYFKRLKAEVLKLADYECVKCEGKATTAHHLRYRNQWTDSRLIDCIAVCQECHDKEHPEIIAIKEQVTRIIEFSNPDNDKEFYSGI